MVAHADQFYHLKYLWRLSFNNVHATWASTLIAYKYSPKEEKRPSGQAWSQVPSLPPPSPYKHALHISIAPSVLSAFPLQYDEENLFLVSYACIYSLILRSISTKTWLLMRSHSTNKRNWYRLFNVRKSSKEAFVRSTVSSSLFFFLPSDNVS